MAGQLALGTIIMNNLFPKYLTAAITENIRTVKIHVYLNLKWQLRY